MLRDRVATGVPDLAVPIYAAAELAARAGRSR